ncbi:hypothetical protein GCM10009718_04530 [Isoptericola halotolerans]|uniref:Chromosome segregation ATPase n=1 Tax=Isoptericola halotolerans TaxID=300560 RepID=A0ABX2A1C5_9MICO|nr:hypothetical protein [Isoptericola halotolerans]NOV96623.1 chromosome segregation ATPase [Isoptericola halotolerans]
MMSSNPLSWLGHQARRGLADLPKNLVWALDSTVKGPAESAGNSLRDVGRHAAATVSDAVPFGDGADSRLARVDAAMERAHELETLAHEEAENAKEQSEAVAQVEAEGRQRVEAAREEADREISRVVDDARQEADAYVAAKKDRAEVLAARRVDSTQADVDAQLEQAQERAEKAQESAEKAIERARQQLGHARELAEEASAAARQAADEASERAERIAGQAEDQAQAARRRADAVDQRTEAAASEGRELGADADTDPLDLDDMTKDQLLDLAGEMGLQISRSTRKAEVVEEIRDRVPRRGRKARAS